MLITDGAPTTNEDVFRKYNWPHKSVSSAFINIYFLPFSFIKVLYCLADIRGVNRSGESVLISDWPRSNGEKAD